MECYWIFRSANRVALILHGLFLKRTVFITNYRLLCRPYCVLCSALQFRLVLLTGEKVWRRLCGPAAGVFVCDVRQWKLGRVDGPYRAVAVMKPFCWLVRVSFKRLSYRR